MPYSITTKDGITIQNIPDDIDPQSDVLKQRVAAIRGGQDDSLVAAPDSGVDTAGAGVEETGLNQFLPDVEQAFQNIPGAPQLSEFAAGVNRSVLGALDFLGPDTLNAILQLSGSETRVPTLTETIGSEGGFVEPGLQRDILQTAGETAPLALGFGQLLRTAAGRLPAVSGGESTATGLLRQAGQTTARADVGLGAAAGAGQEVGEELGGEPGALIGGVVTPLVVAVPLTAAKNTAKQLLKSAPSVDELKNTARGIYQSLDESGVTVPAKAFNRLVSDISRTLSREGLDPDLTPKAQALVRRLDSELGVDKTLTEIDTLRKVARGAAESIEKSEARLGNIAIEKIDAFLDGVGGSIGGGREAGEAFRSARGLWQRARKAELLDEAVTSARDQASGFENGLRTQFRSILKRINSGKLKGFTKEETESIRKVVQGTNAGNIARFLGKFGILDGVTSRSLTSLGGIAVVGGVTGSPLVAGAVPLVGQLSGALSRRMTQNNARMANAIIRAGKNSAKIAETYVRNTPKSERSAEELAQLFLRNDAPIETMRTAKRTPLIAEAAILAAIAKQNDKKEEDK